MTYASSFHKKLEKEEQTKSKAIRRKEMKMEADETESPVHDRRPNSTQGF